MTITGMGETVVPTTHERAWDSLPKETTTTTVTVTVTVTVIPDCTYDGFRTLGGRMSTLVIVFRVGEVRSSGHNEIMILVCSFVLLFYYLITGTTCIYVSAGVLCSLGCRIMWY